MRGLLALCLLVVACAPATAQEDVAAFYRGKIVRIVVGVPVGSGYDISARVLARHLGPHIPGAPTVIVQNQPGAGSLTMTNQLYAAGPFDGTAIGAAFGSMPTTFLLQPGAVRFDPTRLQWIGNTNRESHVAYVWHTAPVQSLDDLRSRELLVGAQSPGTSQYDFPMLANDLFGMKFKVISGYDSTPKIHLAMERGEIQGNAATSWTTLKALNADWLKARKVKPIAQWALRKHPELAQVPLMLDLARTDADRQALLLVLARLEFGRPFFLPPNVPAERVAALRRAFDATVKDPAYLAEAERLKIDVDATTGAEIAALAEQVSRTPPETVARVRAALGQK